MMYINIWFWLFLFFFSYFLYKNMYADEVSVQDALDTLKENLIKLIVFYQSNYNESDQIVLIKKWLDAIDKTKIDKLQLEEFKKYIEKL